MRTLSVPEMKRESGFTIAEFLISTAILLLISASLFRILAETQRTSSYQTEVQAVMDNTRIAMDTVERYTRQASNNPCNIAGFVGIGDGGIMTATSVRLRSDLTGGAGCGSSTLGDQGDPDGDTSDAGEDVTISYDAATSTVNITQGGTVQAVANYISAFNLQYFDTNGVATTVGDQVRKIKITMTGATTVAHPQTHQTFAQTLTSDIQIATRN